MKTKEEVKHTPTPWSFVDTNMQTNNGLEVHRWFSAQGLPLPLTNANAAFIVRAVNSHEALLDALKTWEKFWNTMPKGQMGKLSFDVGLFNEGFLKMRKAIAQAESSL